MKNRSCWRLSSLLLPSLLAVKKKLLLLPQLHQHLLWKPLLHQLLTLLLLLPQLLKLPASNQPFADTKKPPFGGFFLVFLFVKKFANYRNSSPMSLRMRCVMAVFSVAPSLLST